jgi:hypothetical protein
LFREYEGRLRAQLEPLAAWAGVLEARFDDWREAMRPFFELNADELLVVVNEDGQDTPADLRLLVSETLKALPWARSKQATAPADQPELPESKRFKSQFSRAERLEFIGRYGLAVWRSLGAEPPEPPTSSLTRYLMRVEKSQSARAPR